MTLLFASATLASLLSQTPARPATPTTPPTPVAPAPVAQLATPAPPPNPFSHLLTNFVRDIRHMGTAQSAWILGAGGAGALFVHNNHDDRLYKWVQQQDPNSNSSDIGNFLGNEVVQSGGSIALWAIGHATKNVEAETVGSDLIRAHVLNGVLTQGIKMTVRRTRPSGSNYSFPSGHTSSSMATAAVIHSHYGFLKASPLYALSAGIAYSRIRTNHHWLSDTVAGAALGIAAGFASSRDSTSNWVVAPVKTPGGAALYLIRTSGNRAPSSLRK
ncbi:MAG: phosphatase PAP2 family protein [Acidobacteria bacterium]|nr:phosphatase PAP2 family protein [Acidobacteriota bacterium]